MNDNIHSIVLNKELTIATGKSKTRPYEFEIVRALEPLGFRSEVYDAYPNKDGDGYDWEAKIWKRHPLIISESKYREISKYSASDSWNVKFHMEEKQEILIAHGFEILSHTGKAEIIETESDCGGEVRRTGRKWIENVVRVLAVKPEDKNDLPEWNDSQRAYQLDFENQFNKLIRKKLSINYDQLEKRIVDLERILKIKENEEWTRRVEQSERS